MKNFFGILCVMFLALGMQVYRLMLAKDNPFAWQTWFILAIAMWPMWLLIPRRIK